MRYLIISIICLLSSCSISKDDSSSSFKTLYYNAIVYTQDASLPKTSSFITQGENIVYVGDTLALAAQELLRENCIRVNMQNKTILPGFVESHLHPGFSTIMSMDMNKLNPTWSFNRILEEVKLVYEKNPKLEILVFQGFTAQYLNDTPTAKAIDLIVPDKPVLIFDDGFHAAIINTKCMERVGLSATTPDPQPGLQYFERYPNGELTGMVYDVLPIRYVISGLNLIKEEDIYKNLSTLLPKLNSFGFTSLFDAGIVYLDYEKFHNVLFRLQDEGRLNFNYSSCFAADAIDGNLDIISKLEKAQQKYSRDNIYLNTLKFYLDGTLEAQNAATIEPLNGLNSLNKLFIEKQKATELAGLALAKDYNVHIHVIGDMATDGAISVFENTNNIKSKGTKTICHNQMYPKGGVERLKGINNIFFQTTPAWAGKDDVTENIVGKERLSLMYPTASALKNGALVTLGSDYPASPLEFVNPFWEIYYAILRGVDNNEVFGPTSEGLTIDEAIKGYTINGAKQLGISDITGSISVGKNCDFIVIDRDVYNVTLPEIKETKVLQTYYRGKEVE